MWKLIFEYSNGAKTIVTHKSKDATQAQMAKYIRRYAGAASATYQKYPKKDNPPVKIW